MLYQSLKLTNGIWVLAELRIQPGNPSFTVRAPTPALPAPGLYFPSQESGVISDGGHSSPGRLGSL